MDIVEAFGTAINISISKGAAAATEFLGLNAEKIEHTIKSKKVAKEGKIFDIIFDYKPKINQLYIYLTPKRLSKKIAKNLKPNDLDFKSMLIFLGNIMLSGKKTEVRLGACGVSSSDLVKSVIKYKKKI
jgi:hypothetical protein